MALELVVVCRRKLDRRSAMVLPDAIFDGPQLAVKRRTGRLAIDVDGRLYWLDAAAVSNLTHTDYFI